MANYVFMLPYMFIGFEIGIDDKIFNVIKSNIALNIVAFLFASILVLNYKQNYMIHVGNISLLHTENIKTQIFVDLYRWIAGLIVSYTWWQLINYMCGKIKKFRLYKVMELIGRYSLEIYIIHIYLLSFLKKVAQVLNIHYAIYISIIQAIIILVITLGVIAFLKKIKIYNVIFPKKKICISHREVQKELN